MRLPKGSVSTKEFVSEILLIFAGLRFIFKFDIFCKTYRKKFFVVNTRFRHLKLLFPANKLHYPKLFAETNFSISLLFYYFTDINFSLSSFPGKIHFRSFRQKAREFDG